MLEKNYSVKEAVWIAAAAHAYISLKNGNKEMKDLCLTSSELRQNALKYTDSDVQDARIRQWFNADHPNSSNNYLREVLIDGKNTIELLQPEKLIIKNGILIFLRCLEDEMK